MNISQLQAALKQQPENPKLWLDLGHAQFHAGAYSEAREALEKALEILPEHPVILCSLGVSCQLLGDISLAHTHLEAAVTLAPEDPFVLNNLGALHLSQQDYQKALPFFERALALEPDFSEARQNLRQVQRALGLKRDLPQNPVEELQEALALPVVYASSESLLAHREAMLNTLKRLSQQPFVMSDPLQDLPALNFYGAYQGLADRPVQELLAQILRQSAPALTYEAAHLGQKRSGKIKLGFISRFWGDHTIGKLFQNMLRLWDRSDFELSIFGFEPESPFSLGADLHYVPLPQHLAQCQQKVAQAQLDVLFYTDLGMEPLTYFLAFSRLAPLQLITWGHPVTSGLETLDTFVSHRSEHPQAQSHYRETLLPLSHLLPVYAPLPEIASQPLASWGFQKRDILYLCPQSLFKIHPEFDAILAEIQALDPRAQLLFIASPQPTWTRALQSRFAERLDMSRVHFLPRMTELELWQLMASVSLILDPPFFGGGNTSYEAFSLGTPVLTWPSQYYKGRFTRALYETVGLPWWVRDPGQYAQEAVRWAHDPERKKAFRSQIKEAGHLIFNQTLGLRELENWIRAQVF